MTNISDCFQVFSEPGQEPMFHHLIKHITHLNRYFV